MPAKKDDRSVFKNCDNVKVENLLYHIINYNPDLNLIQDVFAEILSFNEKERLYFFTMMSVGNMNCTGHGTIERLNNEIYGKNQPLQKKK